MQRIALATALLALISALLPLASASPDQVTVTVSYEVGGGYTGSYTPIVYEVNGSARIPLVNVVFVYKPNATVSARSQSPLGYAALAGASFAYRPLVYWIQPQVILGNATLRLNVHVRIIKGSSILIPDFDVTYKVNGTTRVVVKGEDVIEWTFTWISLCIKDPLALEFPKEVGDYTLLNSTTIYADPSAETDVWIYYSYGEAPTPTQPPSQPGQQPGGGAGAQPGQQPGGGAGAAPSEGPVERAISEAVWRFMLLLLGLLLIALGLYLWWRSRKRFVLVIEAKG